MTAFALLLITLAILGVSGALIAALLALRQTVLRADRVLALVELEIQPAAAQLRALTEELRTLSRHATEELDRLRAVTERVESLVGGVVRVLTLVGGMTKVGQVVGTAAGVKRGLDVFITKLMSKRRGDRHG